MRSKKLVMTFLLLILFSSLAFAAFVFYQAFVSAGLL